MSLSRNVLQKFSIAFSPDNLKYVRKLFVTFTLRTDIKEVRGRPYYTFGDVPTGPPWIFFRFFYHGKRGKIGADKASKGIYEASIFEPFGPMLDKKTMQTRYLCGFLLCGYQNFCFLP